VVKVCAPVCVFAFARVRSIIDLGTSSTVAARWREYGSAPGTSMCCPCRSANKFVPPTEEALSLTPRSARSRTLTELPMVPMVAGSGVPSIVPPQTSSTTTASGHISDRAVLSPRNGDDRSSRAAVAVGIPAQVDGSSTALLSPDPPTAIGTEAS